MTEFLTGADLASYLGVEETSAIDRIVTLTSNLVDEEWVNPTDPVPAWVTNIAWAVAIRAGANTKGVTSRTRSWDDVTVTDRWDAATVGVELTADQKAKLNSANTDNAAVAPGSISMRIPRWDRAPGGSYGGPDYGGYYGGGYCP
jgi:hypothetical protein